MTIFRFGEFLQHAFALTNNAEYLNESIDVHQAILKIPRAQHIHFEAVSRLTYSLASRFVLSPDIKDSDEMMRLFPIAATSLYASVPDRFQISSQWADFARMSGHLHCLQDGHFTDRRHSDLRSYPRNPTFPSCHNAP